MCREPKHKEARARGKSRGKSAARAQSPQLLQRAVQTRQHPTEENESDRQQCNYGSTECNVAYQEASKEVERVREPNDSNSGSTLENSRDWSNSSIFTIPFYICQCIILLLILGLLSVFDFSLLERLVLRDKFVNVLIM